MELKKNLFFNDWLAKAATIFDEWLAMNSSNLFLYFVYE
jgi:hypothetical protein